MANLDDCINKCFGPVASVKFKNSVQTIILDMKGAREHHATITPHAHDPNKASPAMRPTHRNNQQKLSDGWKAQNPNIRGLGKNNQMTQNSSTARMHTPQQTEGTTAMRVTQRLENMDKIQAEKIDEVATSVAETKQQLTTVVQNKTDTLAQQHEEKINAEAAGCIQNPCQKSNNRHKDWQQFQMGIHQSEGHLQRIRRPTPQRRTWEFERKINNTVNEKFSSIGSTKTVQKKVQEETKDVKAKLLKPDTSIDKFHQTQANFEVLSNAVSSKSTLTTELSEQVKKMQETTDDCVKQAQQNTLVTVEQRIGARAQMRSR